MKMSLKKLPCLLIALGFSIVLVGCTGSTQGIDKSASNKAAISTSSGGDLQLVDKLPPPPNTRSGADQLVAANDILEVDVFQVDELDKTVQVDSNGYFSLPLIGQIKATGKTVPALEKEVESKYGANYLQSPDVTIFVKESAGQRMTLDGQFAKPGVYPTSSNSTLLQAVALGSGLTKLADEEKIYVFRDFSGKKLVSNYNLKDIRLGKIADPRLYGGDIVVAFASNSKIASQNLREALGAAVSVTRIATPL